MKDFLSDPASEELRRLLDEQRRLLGPTTLEQIKNAMKSPAERIGLSDFAQDPLHREHQMMDDAKKALGIGGIGGLSGSVLNDAAAHGGFAAAALKSIEDTENPRKVEHSWSEPDMFEPAFVPRGPSMVELLQEQLEVGRRHLAATETALHESERREAEERRERTSAERREETAHRETRRWQIIAAIGVVAGLLLTAWGLVKDLL
jgi:hypothetical protein